MAISYNGDICVVLDSQHRTPGNLRAFVQATLRSIRTGKSSDVRFSSTERIEPVPMITKKMEFSYKDGDDFVFTDPETYETVTITPELVGDAKNYLVENGTVTMVFVEEKAVSVELPPSVVLTVADAPIGKPVEVEFYRDGKRFKSSITLASSDSAVAARPRSTEPAEGWFGLAVEELPKNKRVAGLSGVVVTGVEPDSIAAEGGIQRGDVIVSVNQKRVGSLAEYAAAMKLAERRGAAALLIRRGSASIYFALKIR